MTAALAVVGGIVSAVGALAAASAQANAAKYNAAVAERNRMASLAQGDAEASDKIRENRRKFSAIRAAIGASGIDIAGSPLDVIGDAAIESELDVRRIRYKAELRATDYADKAELSRMEAKSATTAGFFNAASGLLGGFTQAGTSLSRNNGNWFAFG